MLSAAALILEFLSAVVDKECGEFLDAVLFYKKISGDIMPSVEHSFNKRERATYIQQYDTGCCYVACSNAARFKPGDGFFPPHPTRLDRSIP